MLTAISGFGVRKCLNKMRKPSVPIPPKNLAIASVMKLTCMIIIAFYSMITLKNSSKMSGKS